MLRSVCRSPSTGGTAQTRPGGSVAGAGWWRITGQRAGAAVRADNRKRGGSHRPLPGTTSCLSRRSRDRSCGRAPGDGRDGCAAGNRAARNRRVPAPIPAAVLSSLTRPHTTVAIGRGSGQDSRTGFDFDYTFLENYSIRGQGIIARWTRRRSRWTRGRGWLNVENSTGVPTTGCVRSRPPQTLEKNIGRVPVQRRILWLLGGREWSYWRTGHCPNPK